MSGGAKARLILINERGGYRTLNSAHAPSNWANEICFNPLCGANRCWLRSFVTWFRCGADPDRELQVYEGTGETSECAVELGVSRMRTGTETIVLGVQGFHPNDTSPQFEHENDLVAAWPNISASEIKAFLTRIN